MRLFRQVRQLADRDWLEYAHPAAAPVPRTCDGRFGHLPRGILLPLGSPRSFARAVGRRRPSVGDSLTERAWPSTRDITFMRRWFPS